MLPLSERSLDLIREKFGFCLIIVGYLGENPVKVVQSGQLPRGLDHGLRASLFGDEETMHRLLLGLDGQPGPQSWAQGNVRCHVDTLINGTVIGLFLVDSKLVAAAERQLSIKAINDLRKEIGDR